MFEKIGYYSVKFRYYVVAFWLIAAATISLVAPDLRELSISDQAGYLDKNEPCIKAQEMIKKYFPNEIISNAAVLVIKSLNGPLKTSEGFSVLSDITNWLKSLKDPKISDVIISPADPNLVDRLVSSDGRVALIIVGINGSPEDRPAEKTISNMKERMGRLPSGYKGYVTGDVAISNAYKICSIESVENTVTITILLVIACLLLIYRSPILPVVPLVIIGVAYGISRGVVGWLAMNGLVISSVVDLFMVTILFGAGTDYCLFIISRFKEYMADGLSAFEAATNTMARVGETITSSAGTVIVADLALSFVSVKMFSSTGPSLAIAVLIALCAVMTLTPAMLAIIGKRAFWPGKPKHAHEANIWGRIGHWITRMPWVMLTLALLVMVPLAIYGLGQKDAFDVLTDLPEDNMAKEGFNVLASSFSVGELSPVDLLITNVKDMRKPEGIAEIAATTQELLKIPGVTDVRSLTSPAGKASAFASKVLRVDFQLNQIADQIDTAGTVFNYPSALSSFIYSAGGRFSILREYFADLADVFPDLSSNINYNNATASLDRLWKKYNASARLLKVPGQLAEINERMKESTEINPSVVVPQMEMLQSYFAGLAQAVPAAAQMEGYTGILSVLNELHNRFLEFKGMSAVTRSLSMIKQKGELENLKTTLNASLSGFKKEADTKLADTLYVPPVLPREMKQTLNPILIEMGIFKVAVRNLAVNFSKRPNGFYAPVELAKLQDGGALTMMLNTYTSVEGDAARYQLVLKYHPFSLAAMDTVKQIRKVKLQRKFYVGGNIAVLSDLRDAMKRDTVLMWVLVCGGIMVVLVFLLRSIVAPVYLLGTIILGYYTCMGLVRFVFEYLLGKEITWFVPFFMFVLLLALGMDYNIFLMGRVKEEVAVYGTKKGIRRAVLHTGGIITSAGIIMAGTFAAMMSASLMGLVELAFAISVGVLLDTFVTRTMLVPAIVVLLDKWNWWPGHIIKKKKVEEDATVHNF